MDQKISTVKLLVFIYFVFSVLPIKSAADFTRHSPEDVWKIFKDSKGGLAVYTTSDGSHLKLKVRCNGIKTLSAFQLNNLPNKLSKTKKRNGGNVKFGKNATSVVFHLQNSSYSKSLHMTPLPEINVKKSKFAIYLAVNFGKEFQGTIIIGDQTKICSCFELHVKSSRGSSHSRRKRSASNYPCEDSQRISRAVVVLNVAYASLSSQERQAITSRMASYAAVSLSYVDIVRHTGFVYVFYPATMLEFISGDHLLTVANSTVIIVLNSFSFYNGCPEKYSCLKDHQILLQGRSPYFFFGHVDKGSNWFPRHG